MPVQRARSDEIVVMLAFYELSRQGLYGSSILSTQSDDLSVVAARKLIESFQC